jgi:hypothetical protein
VNTILRPVLGAAVAAIAIGALGIVPAHADDDDNESKGPSVAWLQAKSVGSSTATLTAMVTARNRSTSYRFDYGPTTSYGQSVGGTVTGDSAGVPVSVSLQGLSPKTVYHIRVVVWNSRGSDAQTGWPFTTRAAPVAVAPAPAPAPTATAPAGSAPTTLVTPEPTLGQSMVVAPVEGTVKVRETGTGTFVVLGAGDTVPVGSVVDTRDGAVALTSELAGGRTQTATFGDGLFEVRQSPERDGLTDIILRGGNFAVCGGRRAGRGRAAAVAAAGRTSPKRRLWAKDSGGRFRTRGRNSVATVRGTRWVTTDTCAGTRTTVTEGSVSVRDLRARRTVVVRAGRSHLARGRR